MLVDKNPDGSDSPMDEPYYEAEQIAPGTWRILSSGDYSYLVAGENEAVSIDTGYFEKAYMAEAGVPYASQPYDSFAGIDFPQDYQRVGIKEGFVYDLGGRTLEVFDIPDHTTDGIALLDRKERLLFTGDEFMVRGKHLNVPLLVFLEYLEKLAAHPGDHGPDFFPPEPGYEPDTWVLEYAGVKVFYDRNKLDMHITRYNAARSSFFHINLNCFHLPLR